MTKCPVNNCTSQAFLSIIEYYCLSRSDCSCRFVKGYRYLLSIFTNIYSNSLINLTIAELRSTVEMVTISANNIIYLVNITSFQMSSIEMGIVVTLSHNKNIALDIFANNKPWLITFLIST